MPGRLRPKNFPKFLPELFSPLSIALFQPRAPVLFLLDLYPHRPQTSERLAHPGSRRREYPGQARRIFSWVLEYVLTAAE